MTWFLLNYRIDVYEDNLKIFNELLSFTSLTGRFPYPRSENDIINFENNKSSPGSLGIGYNIKIGKFIENQVKIISE